MGRPPSCRGAGGRRDPSAAAADAAERFPRTAFTGSVEEAIAAAKEIAGDEFVTIASADIIQQALNLGLVDEVCISQVPVLFGTGIRYFGELVGEHVMLEDPVVVQGVRGAAPALPGAALIGRPTEVADALHPDAFGWRDRRSIQRTVTRFRVTPGHPHRPYGASGIRSSSSHGGAAVPNVREPEQARQSAWRGEPFDG